MAALLSTTPRSGKADFIADSSFSLGPVRAQHTKAVDWVPGADKEATMEREMGGDVSIANGRRGPWVVPMVQGRADPWWSDGIPPGRKSARVPRCTGPESAECG